MPAYDRRRLAQWPPTDAVTRFHYVLCSVECGALERLSYCGAHWARWDVFDQGDPAHHDSIRGRCPVGHERMLED